MKRDAVHEDLREVAEKVVLHSHYSYSFDGRVRDLKANPATAISEKGEILKPETGNPPALRFLESELYQRLYRRPTDKAQSIVKGGDPAFIHQLSEANKGLFNWESGWRIVNLSDSQKIGLVQEGEGILRNVTCWVSPRNVRLPEGAELEMGLHCQVKMPKELRHLVLGYYMAMGDTPHPESARRVRLYWNLAGQDAPDFIKMITSGLNREKIPFRCKVVGHSAMYHNADAGVLYLVRSDFSKARKTLQRLVTALNGCLRYAVPMFTKRLAPGLGLAEDPDDGSSFGQSRCRILAQGLWRDLRLGGGCVETRAEAISHCFLQAGIDPSKPYLTPGSVDNYNLKAL